MEFLKLITKAITSLILILALIIFTGNLSGCATERSLGYGTVLEQYKIKNKNYKPHKRTLVGAGVGIGTGAGIGAVGGAVVGGLAGELLGTVATVFTLGLAAPSIPVLTSAGIASGAAEGALLGGASGGVIGAGIGYVADVHHQGIGLYRYLVKPDKSQNQPITVTQYANQLMSPYSRVQIIKKQNEIFIKPGERNY